jgi:uncharacterized membrane protein
VYVGAHISWTNSSLQSAISSIRSIGITTFSRFNLEIDNSYVHDQLSDQVNYLQVGVFVSFSGAVFTFNDKEQTNWRKCKGDVMLVDSFDITCVNRDEI